MCGIVAYTGDNKASVYLLESLLKLEYRGYDSAGIALIDEKGFNIKKQKGRISELIKSTQNIEKNSYNCGIAHTRWATHGEATKINAHPHKSFKGNFCVVHNGIIENYELLKKELQSEGVEFFSDTDTEVIPNMIEKYYEGDFLKAVIKACSRFEGAYAIAVLCKLFPGRIVCTGSESPLVVAKNDNECFAASDTAPLAGACNSFYKLSENEFAVLSERGLSFFNENAESILKEELSFEGDMQSVSKGRYPHYMLKEIYEQPFVLEKTLKSYLLSGTFKSAAFGFSEEELSNITKIQIVACGSAYNAGLMGKYIIEELSGIAVECEIASEYRYKQVICDKNTLCIAVSQSGETADTIAALKKAKKLTAKTLSVVNVPFSTLENESDKTIYTLAGKEIAVATTKAYICQVGVMCLFALYMARLKKAVTKNDSKRLLESILLMPEKIKAVLQKQDILKEISDILKDKEHIYFIGRNTDYPACLEAALKLKEISYIHCEAYPAGELKHGTISLIENGSVVVALAQRKKLVKKTLSNIKEVVARKGDVTVLASEDLMSHFEEQTVYSMPSLKHDIFSGIFAVVAMQIVSYFTADARGCDIDKPRNLAKSVTVE